MAYPATPKNNFGSGISTASPFSQGQVRTASKVQQAYTGPDQSRSAFARALTDTSKGEIKNAFADKDQEYRQKAETLRSRDTRAVRENQAQRYAMQQEKAVTLKKQDVGLRQNLADLEAYRIRGEKDSRNQGISNIAGAVLGVASMGLPGASALTTSWIREDRGGGGRSVFGMGLMR